MWKLDLKSLQKRVIKYGNLKIVDKYYERYDYENQVIIKDTIIEYLLAFKKNLLEIEGSIPKELYNKLEIRK